MTSQQAIYTLWTQHNDLTEVAGYIDTASTSGGKFTALPVTGGVAGAWNTVPEPTSGLILLLGVAGLALRRRRA